MSKRLLPAMVLGLACPVMATAAYPDRPISMVVPYAPGGTADGLARVVALGLAERLNANIVVENKPGASGMIGAGYVARAKGDGYTLLYDATPLSINPALHKTPFNVKNDFVPLSLVSVMPLVLVVSKNSKFNSVQEIVAAAKADRKNMTFASGGVGTVQYMAGELFSQGFGTQMLHVPYKSGGPAIMAEMSGEVDMGFNNISSILPTIKSGDLRSLAVTSPERDGLLPAVPTLNESGLPGYEIYEWNGVLAPKGTPAEIVTKLQLAIQAVLKQAAVREKFTALGAQVVASSSAEFQEYLDKEVAKWNSVVAKAGMKNQ